MSLDDKFYNLWRDDSHEVISECPDLLLFFFNVFRSWWMSRSHLFFSGELLQVYCGTSAMEPSGLLFWWLLICWCVVFYLFWTCESCRPSARTGCRTRASCWAKWCVRDSTGRRRTWRPVRRCRPSDPLGRSHLSEIHITYFWGGLVWFGLEKIFGRLTRVWEKKWKPKTKIIISIFRPKYNRCWR